MLSLLHEKKRAFASWKTVSKFSFMLGTLSLVKKRFEEVVAWRKEFWKYCFSQLKAMIERRFYSWLMDSYFRCIMNPKALCEGRPNSRESCSQVIKGFFFAQPQVYFCVQIVVSALLHLLPRKRSKIADTACTQTWL